MPANNGMGPQGLGPKTGRQMGKCGQGKDAQGLGRGNDGQRLGRGRRMNRLSGLEGCCEGYGIVDDGKIPYNLLLEHQKNILESRLAFINQAIEHFKNIPESNV